MLKNAFSSEHLWYYTDNLEKVYLIRHVNNCGSAKYVAAQ